MKELTIEQMEIIRGGSLKKALTCASLVIGGMGTLAGFAAMGTLMVATPIGWGFIFLGAASLLTGAVASPDACD